MIDVEWEWTIVFHDVDEAFPRFAQIAQKALNVSNHVAQNTGELETAVNMIDIINDPGFKEQDGWKKLVVSSMEALAIPCASYADVILDFVLDFGGDVDAPEIRFMHNVAQQFGASKTLGQK